MFLGLFILACLALVALATYLERNDASEHRAYHRLHPAEDGCVHEVQLQNITGLPDYTAYVNRIGDACPYCVRGVITTSYATCCDECAELDGQGRLLRE